MPDDGSWSILAYRYFKAPRVTGIVSTLDFINDILSFYVEVFNYGSCWKFCSSWTHGLSSALQQYPTIILLDFQICLVCFNKNGCLQTRMVP